MEVEDNSYFPFRDLSAWFSCSVNPSIVEVWKKHGGELEGESAAMYIFSDDPFTKDTTRLYGWLKEVVVVQTSWIKEVLEKQCQVKEVVLGRHLLTPHFMIGLDLMNKKVDSAAEIPGAKNETMTQSDTTPPIIETPATTFVRTPGKGREEVSTSNHNDMQGCGGGGGSCSQAALSMQTRYNAVWNKLEQDCTDNKPEGILHVEHVKPPTNAILVDFDVSRPEFKVYKRK